MQKASWLVRAARTSKRTAGGFGVLLRRNSLAAWKRDRKALECVANGHPPEGDVSQPAAVPRREPDRATVEALLETTWRLVDAERARREGINQKASSLATFASLVLSLTATLGAEFLERLDEAWALSLYLVSLVALAGTIAVAIFVLLPRGRVTLGMAYIESFPTWSEITKPPEQVRGETMRGLVAALAHDRALNERDARRVFAAFLMLFVGLTLVAAEAAISAIAEFE
jgi:hypothetical protein